MTDHSLRMIIASERRSADEAGRGMGIVNAVAGRSSVAVVAARAGRIAPLTGELARAIAGRSHRLYCRAVDTAGPERGRATAVCAAVDEPVLRSVLAGARTVVSIADCPTDEDAMTVIRGTNRELALRLWAALTETGFAAMLAPAAGEDTEGGGLLTCPSEGGVELMLTRRLRRDLGRGIVRRPLFDRYVAAVRRALAEQPPRWTPERVLVTAQAVTGVVPAAPMATPA